MKRARLRCARRIKRDIDACRTVPDVNDTVRHYFIAWRMLHRSRNQTDRVMAMHIKNLSAWKRRQIIREQNR